MGFGSQYATHCLISKACKALDMKTPVCPPYNTAVQVIERSWRRSHWKSQTVKAWIRCPSADTSRELVVRTENGSLLTTGKVWQSVVKPKLKIEVDGEPIEAQPIVPDVPTHRVKGKTQLSALLYPQCSTPSRPKPADSSVEQLPSKMFEKQVVQPEHLLATLVAAMPARMFETTRPATAFEGDSFFTGSYARGNLVGISNHARN